MYEQLFEHQENVFKVIANQKRLEIIQLLTHGEMAVNEMVEMLGIPQSNVSQHLSLLRHAGIVQTRKSGKAIHYSLKDPKIAEACSLIRQFLVSENHIQDTSFLDSDTSSLYPLVQDPVCGMRMAISEASQQHQHKGKSYFFCASGCKDKFTASPASFTK